MYFFLLSCWRSTIYLISAKFWQICVSASWPLEPVKCRIEMQVFCQFFFFFGGGEGLIVCFNRVGVRTSGFYVFFGYIIMGFHSCLFLYTVPNITFFGLLSNFVIGRSWLRSTIVCTHCPKKISESPQKQKTFICAQKPEIHYCICSNYFRLGFYAEFQIIIRTVYT